MPANEITIEIPYAWRPRAYQQNIVRARLEGIKRILVVAHRRWGKDATALNLTAMDAIQTPGVYWHLLPEQAQARKAIWTAVDPHTGKRRIDQAFPHEIRRATREQEMAIELVNGSLVQFAGSDNYNSLVGSSPRGIVFSEWALADPAAWAYMRPILRENDGWAMFITTPRGRNHCWRMFQEHKNDPDWFVELSPATQTDVFSEDSLAVERRELVAEYGEAVGSALFEQEYLCSFEAAVMGAVYGGEMRKAREQERVTRAPYDPRYKVVTAWDLGRSDATAIWFAQFIGGQVVLIDYEEGSGGGLTPYVKMLAEKPYVYELDILPHDAGHRRQGQQDDKSIAEQLKGLRPISVDQVVLPNSSRASGIEQARLMFPLCVFDERACARGLDCLAQYHYAWDERARRFSVEPVHDWSSHGADAFRYLALGRPNGPAIRQRNDFWDEGREMDPWAA